MAKIGFIGTGNMGGALAMAVAKTGHEIVLCNAHPAKAEALKEKIGGTVADHETVIGTCDFVFLGVKPQMLADLASQISPYLAKRKGKIVFISMVAGVTIQDVERLFVAPLAGPGAVIRIMPNTPVAVGAGMILYCLGDNVTETEEKVFLDMLRFAGRLDPLPERLIDAGSAVSGCGPAFACMFAEALADGGVRCGLPRKKALEYAVQMMLGTAALLDASGEHPGKLKDDVCSPAGSTIEGVTTLEERAFRAAVTDAVTAAYRRTAELGK